MSATRLGPVSPSAYDTRPAWIAVEVLVVRACIEEGIEQVRATNARATHSTMTNNGLCFPDGLSVEERTDQQLEAALQLADSKEPAFTSSS